MLWLSQGAKATGRYRNSSWLGHQADAVIEIQEPKAENTIRDLCVRKKRMDVFSYRVELAHGQYQLVTGSRPEAKGDAPKLSGERRKVLKALVAGMSYTVWRAAYGGNANTFKKEVGVLDGLGLVTQDVEHGTWAPVQFTVEQELAA
jgi:hypothetical protein